MDPNNRMSIGPSLGWGVPATPAVTGAVGAPQPNLTPAARSLAVWTERVEPSSGQKFFYNTTTRQTSWTLPAGASVSPSGNFATPQAEPKAVSSTHARAQAAAKAVAVEEARVAAEDADVGASDVCYPPLPHTHTYCLSPPEERVLQYFLAS